MANFFGNVISDCEGRDGSFIVRRFRSAVPSDQKVTNSRHMMAPKLKGNSGRKITKTYVGEKVTLRTMAQVPLENSFQERRKDG